MGIGGNPNDLVNCFNVADFGGTAPFFVDQVRFFIGESIPLPSSLSVRLFAASPSGLPVETPLFEEIVPNLIIGENTVSLSSAFEVTTQEICVGVFAGNEIEGLRIRNEIGLGDQSFVRAPNCLFPTFSSLDEVGLPVRFCIEALVFGL